MNAAPRLAALCAPAALLLLPVTVVAEARPLPTFSSGVEMVNLNVAVVGSEGRFVTGLGERDFAIYEDGVRQKLTLFAQDRLPLSLAIVLDTSASMEGRLPLARAAAARLVEALGPADEAEVVQFADRVEVQHGFTTEREALLDAIGRTRAGGSTALYNAVYVTARELESRGRGSVPRRRAMVVLSDGQDTASRLGDDQVIDTLRRASVHVYVVSLCRRLPGEAADEPRDRAIHFLTTLARDTGGQVWFPAALPELDGIYGRIAEELQSQYTLGYTPSGAHREGVFRKISILTPGRPLEIRHRLGYVASR